jgi:hypothetical protein
MDSEPVEYKRHLKFSTVATHQEMEMYGGKFMHI